MLRTSIEVQGMFDTYCVNVSPTTTSRIPTTFSCLHTMSELISRNAVIGNPFFSSSSLSFFSATMSPVSLSLARNTTPYEPSSIELSLS